MRNSLNFIKSKIRKESIIVESVKSASEEDKEYLVHKKQNNWFCTCKSFQVRKECRHIKLVTEPIGEGEKCFNCGKTAWISGLDKHHVDRRSTNPESINNARKIMLLCRKDHERATNDVRFENNLKKIWSLLKE